MEPSFIINDMEHSLQDMLPHIDASSIILNLGMENGEFRHLTYQFKGDISESDKRLAAHLLANKCAHYGIPVCSEEKN